MRDCALDYAVRLGWAVFPTGADCKTPKLKGGCHAASSDPDQVARLFAREANIGLAAGRRSGVVVVDVDVKGGVDGLTTLAVLEDALGRLPETWESRTPSGGRHLFFAQPERPLTNRVGFQPGLDLRTCGGSVALPPSRRAEGEYRWRVAPGEVELGQAPAWLLAAMTPPSPPLRPPPRPRISLPERGERYAARAVDGECGELAAMPAHSGRNQRLFVASARLGELAGAGLLSTDQAQAALERAAFDCGLTRDDGIAAVRATIRSGLGRGLKSPREVRP